MKTNKKKGFTIVELVIVVAIIGILASILIPTFVNLSNKANIVADSAIVTNINKQLAISEIEDGKNKTMFDALEDAKTAGYLVANINASSNNEIVWDQDLDRFALIDKDGNVIAGQSNNTSASFRHKLWKTYSSMPQVQTYSIYAVDNFSASNIVLNVGFDAGNNSGIETINYTHNESNVNAQTVIIRTNGEGTTLTVDAPLDTVHHYDYLDELTVIAVANASYHEHGMVRGKAVISQGHIEIEDGADVSEVVVKNVPTSKIVKVTANESTVINVDAPATQVSVVANSEDIYISGLPVDKISGSQADNVELPTVVTTEAELSVALTANKPYIQLGANFTADNAYTINSKTLLDFAGFTISSSLMRAPFITNDSTLTFVDSASNGGITSSNNNIVINNGSMIINGGKFSGNRAYTITESTEEGRESRGVINNAVNATMTINNIDVYVKADFAILNFGDMIINKGNFVSDAESGAFADSRYAYCITQYGDGNLIINNATISAVHGGIGINGGKATINDATVTLDKTKNSYYALYIAGEIGYPEVIINGGTYTGKTKSLYVGNKSDGGLGNLAMATVNDGTFYGDISVVTTSANNYGIGSLKIYGGKFGVNVKAKGINGVVTCQQVDGLWVVNK